LSILIKSIELNGKQVDILIEGDLISKIAPQIETNNAIVIDGRRKAVIPGLANMHAHSAMTLFRGYADDMPLKPWLEEKIWPNEKKLTAEDVYWGARLACLEMVKSGTTLLSDMYDHLDETEKAVSETGIRAVLAEVCFDFFKPHIAAKSKQQIIKRFSNKPTNERIQYALGPHAIYTVSGDLLKWAKDFALDNDVFMHLHLAETEQEVADCQRDFGDTPVRYLRKIGVLSHKLIIAHGLYVDDEEIKMLADAGVAVVHNPASNMKLGSGYQFRFKEMKQAGVRVALGTDGCASSNNLDMIEVMKLASLLGKSWRKDPTALSCNEMLDAITVTPAEILGIKTGKIATGYKADLCLIDLQRPEFTPNHNFVSNLVYSANGSCVDTVICDGKIVMQNRTIDGEAAIMDQAKRCAYQLITRK
jgi:5-methylthioadenosine/S-adenosylhomocysteine deaminase